MVFSFTIKKIHSGFHLLSPFRRLFDVRTAIWPVPRVVNFAVTNSSFIAVAGCCCVLCCFFIFFLQWNFHGTYGLHEEVSAIVSIVFNKKYVLFLFLMVLKYSFAEHKNTEYYYLCLFTRNIYRPSHTHMLLVYDQSDYELFFSRSSSYALSRYLLRALALSFFVLPRSIRLGNCARHDWIIFADTKDQD